MAKFVISTFIEKGDIEIKLNDKVIPLDNGKIEEKIEDNQYYVFSWLVKGEVGSSFRISISSPRYAEFQLHKIIGKSGEDVNSFQFNT
ncbi:hypothetical protein [Flexithrix dorotheae]|uniref:hypothetical protein n=1 Tax=Flexithrix dorotheae TaxID=70993 RepID=UPI0003820883|nr:hypothetical protein [Flexithrix dorotheae]